MTKTDDKGLRQQDYAKGEYLPMENDDLTAVLSLGIQALKRGAVAKYTADKEGYERFIEHSQQYLDYVNAINQNPDIAKKLVVDIESWCVYCGITRETLRQYDSRGGIWHDFISYFKEIVVMCKKQLAFNYKIPPMFATFDLVNNHQYHNTNEFHFTSYVPKEEGLLTEEELIERARQLPDFDNE